MLTIAKLCLVLATVPSLLAAPTPDERILMPRGFDNRSVEDHQLIARQYGVQIINNCYSRNQMALTFDDGFQNQEMDFANLFPASKGMSTTFFVTGKLVGCIYDHADQLRELYNRGYVVGAHTWSHPDLNRLQEWEVDMEFDKLEQAFIKILGVKPLYFRPPYGYYGDTVLRVAGRRGYTKMFLWTDTTWDWTENLDQQKARIDGYGQKAPNPQQILMHSIQPYSYDAAKYAIDKLGAKGYKFVNANTCTGGGPAYKVVGLPQERDSTWTCDA